MERIQFVQKDNSEVLDESISLNESILLSTSFEERDNNAVNDSAFYEKFFLDDLDSHWVELNGRLCVLRMASDSVIEGTVNAVVEEAAEKITMKEVETAILNKTLHSCKVDADLGSRLGTFSMVPKHGLMNAEIDRAVSLLRRGFLDASVELSYTEHVGRLRIAAEEQFQRLKENTADLRDCYSSDRIRTEATANERLVEIDERIDGLKVILLSGFEQISDVFGLIKALNFEHQWEHEFQKEVASIMIRDYIRDLHHEFDAKLYEQRGLIETLNMRWHKKITELTTLHKELDAISTSLLGSEMGMLFTHNSRESFEEVNVVKRKDGESISSHHQAENGNLEAVKSVNSDDFMLDVADFLHLKPKPSEEIIKFFISEMTKMRRQHDVALQEKTEELFRLKREFHREKGMAPFKKDREFEIVRKKVFEVVSKLDEILFNNSDFPAISKDCEELCRLKDRVESLFYENQHLRSLLSEKREEVKHLSSQVSDAASKMSLHSSLEATLLKQIKKLKGEVEDLKIEGNFKEVLNRTILRGNFDDYSCCMEDIEIQTNIMQETYSIFFEEVLHEAISATNPAIQKYVADKASLEEMLLEKEKALSLANEENQKLKQEITSLSNLMSEKDQLALEAGSMLRDQVGKQETLILDFRKESDLMKSRLDETSQRVLDYELEISKLKRNLNTISNALEGVEKQNLLLRGIIEEKQKALSPSIVKDKEQDKWLECSAIALTEMSKAFDDFENKMQKEIRRNENRLKTLSYQCNPLVQQAITLKKKELWYKQMLEIRCSDLQKAEAEVDLLGDEVDSLLSLLGKTYVALDHYSPVLQHYPGVMEILKLVQKELKGENLRSM